MQQDKARSAAGEGGVTLIETMIVVAIIAILSAVAMPAYYNHLIRGRQSEIVSELMVIRAAQERFFAENGGYAGRMDMEGFNYSTSGTYHHAGYEFWITTNSRIRVASGTIRGLGDPNGDGQAYDGWELSLANLQDQPKPYDTGGSEGLGWSVLGHLFD